MDLLEKINNCSEEELKEIIDATLQDTINGASKKDYIGFPTGILVTKRITPHKGFIAPEIKIHYNNYSLYNYSMKTTDYFYEFAKYVKKNSINNKSKLVRYVETFINYYFGISNGCDVRDAYFDQTIWQDTLTEDEAFDKIDNLEIGEFRGKNIAMCTERAALAQNLLSLFGFEIYYCIGCVNHNGNEVPHCFNIARAKNKFCLLDYSLPVPVFKDSKVVLYIPFQADIELNEINDVLFNGVNKEFPYYEWIITLEGQKKMETGIRCYNVGSVTFEKTQTKSK